MELTALQALKTLIGFRQEPPTIDEFLDDSYYLGGLGWNIYPFWRKKLRELYPDNVTTSSTYVVLTGSIGGGKTFFSTVVILYDICKLCCVYNLREFLNTNATQGFHIKMFNLWKHKVEALVNTLVQVIWGGKVPFFQRQLDSGDSFLNDLRIDACAKEKDMVSDDVICFHINEANFLRPDVAKSLFNSSDSRLTSRFIEAENVFTHLIIDSSTTGAESPVDTFLKTDPKATKAFVVRVNAWNTTEGLGRYFNYGSFEVYCGDGKHRPMIVPEKFPNSERLQLDPERFIQVPNELKPEFERDIILALTEKAGLSVATINKFFADQERLNKSFTLDKDSDDVVIMDFFDPSDTLFSKIRDDVSKLPTDRSLFVACDCGVSGDLFGLAIGYGDGVKSELIDGNRVDRILIKIPIVVGISRYNGQETPIPKISDFIILLNNSFNVRNVGTDQYQSTQLRQELTQVNIEAELRSVDRDDNAYVVSKNYMYSGLVQICKNNLLMSEMSNLERVGPKKVDHPVTSSKDLSDAVVSLISKMVALGPEEVLAPPEEDRLNDWTEAFGQMSRNRSAKQVRSRYSAYDYI